jgi:hypothetical protein
VTGHCDQRNRRRALVKYPDRFETAHVRHEDIDDHQVEARSFQRAMSGFAAIGDRYFKAVAFGLLRSSNDPVEKACQFSLPTLRARIIIGEFGVYVLGASARDGLIRKALATRPYL